MKCDKQFDQTRKKNLSNENCVKHKHIIGFHKFTVLLMVYFSHYHNTEYKLHMNIPAANTGMLMIIKTYDNN